MSADLYETDFHARANRQAALPRAGDFSAADMERIAEEIESMGRSEKRELVSRPTVSPLHLLKRRFQPTRRGASAHPRAVRGAWAETGLTKSTFPEARPRSFETMTDRGFWPDWSPEGPAETRG